MSGSGVLIYTTKSDTGTIAFSEAGALQAKKEPAVLLQERRLSRNSESTIWGLESQKTIRREWSENDKRRQGGF